MSHTLREKAEALLNGDYPLEDAPDPSELPKLLHELRIHQVELELQNEELRRTQQELQEAQRKYFNYYHLAPVCYLTLDASGKILEANHTAHALLGVERLKLINRPLMIYIVPQDYEKFSQHLIATSESSITRTCELELVRQREGQTTFVHAESKWVQQPDGSPVFWTILSDISERKSVEMALREREMQLTEAQRIGRIASWKFEQETRRATWSDEMYRLLGYEVSAIMPSYEQLLQHIERDDRRRFEAAMNDLLSAGQPLDIEFCYLSRLQGRRHAHLRGHRKRSEEGSLTTIHGTFQDITERKLAEIALSKNRSALQESQTLYRSLTDNLPDAVVLLFDADLRYLLAAGKALDYLQRHGRVFEGNTLYDLATPDQLAELAPRYLAVFEGQRLQFEFQVRERYYDCILVPIPSPDGGIRQGMLMGLDVTERKHLQKQALQLALEQERIQMLAHFMQDASHEFRTPLSIAMASTYVLRRISDHPEAAENLDIIDEQIARIRGLVDALLLITRLDSEITPQIRPVSVNYLIEMALEVHYDMITERQLRIEKQLVDDVPLVPADNDLAQRVVSNVLHNAIRFSPQGGTVTITTEAHQDGLIVAISDEGDGIPSDQIEHIFKRLYRVDKAHSTAGFGLGLPIARKILDLHQGRIWIDSRLGQGTTVYVYFSAQIEGS